MPGRTATQHEDRLYPENWFPFSPAAATDPISGNSGGIILTGAATDPKIIETNSATEYWQKGASLVHTEPGCAARPRLAGQCPRLPDRRDPAWRPPRGRSAAGPQLQPAQPAQRDPGLAGPLPRARGMGDARHRAAAEPGPLASPPAPQSRPRRSGCRASPVGEAAERARYDRSFLHDGFRRLINQRVKDGELTEAGGTELAEFYESRYGAYTYLAVNGARSRSET